jgi:hypothetical protein
MGAQEESKTSGVMSEGEEEEEEEEKGDGESGL